MRTTSRRPKRRGSVMPIMAILGTSMIAMTALAMDLGLLAVSRTNCQSVADAAALTATRTLDNKPTSTNSNQTNALAAANAVVASNVLNTNAGQTNTTTVEFGLYKYYDTTTTPVRNPAQFEVVQWYPSGSALPVGEKSWTATRVTLTANQPGIFSYALGTSNIKSYGRAVSVYRPRDIAMTLDMTGSMRFGSTVRSDSPYNFLSCDPVYPQMGHWARYTEYAANDPNVSSNAGGAAAGRNNPFFTSTPFVKSSGELLAPTNFTATNAGGPPAVKDWYYDPANLADPTSPVITPVIANLQNAFHHWDPSVSNPGDPDNYVPATLNYSNWAASTDPMTTYSIYPVPADFGDQTNPGLIGDKLPRKKGAERLSSPGTWDPTTANGAAYTLAEYLGWTNAFVSGNPTSATNGYGPPGTTRGRTTSPALTTALSIGRTASNTTYATDWSNFRDATWEQYGYDLDIRAYVNNRPAAWDPRSPASSLSAAARVVLPVAQRFKGYVVAPGYWGKSFFVWPPDPRQPVGQPGDAGYVAGDWRRRFFFQTDAPTNAAINANQLNPDQDNRPGSGTSESINEVLLRNGTGETLSLITDPNQINYRAVLKWIKSPPMCLPPNLRAGRVVYYTSIPDDVDTSTGSTEVRRDKAFWKQYIDRVLRSNNLMDFETRGWPEGASPLITQTDMTQYDIDGSGGPIPPDPRPYMNYLDNPSRPRHNFWFGPLTMMSMLADEVSWAGTIHETQTWQLKAGVNSVLDDIRNNHPNDNVGLSYFTTGIYHFMSVACSQDFDLLKASLFYPKPLVENGSVWNNTSAEFAAFDVNMSWRGSQIVQNAQGGTNPNAGMANCFNILAPTATTNPSRPTLPPAPYGTSSSPRRGRRGASKIVIFETDGVPNATTTTSLQSLGYNSYYTFSGGVSASYTDSSNAALGVVDKIVAPLASGTSGSSGLSTSGSPARVYSIGFGDLFSIEPQTTTALQAREFLLNVQKRGGTSGAGDAAIPAYQIITGPYQQRIDSLKTAFERILQSGVQVTLIE